MSDGNNLRRLLPATIGVGLLVALGVMGVIRARDPNAGSTNSNLPAREANLVDPAKSPDTKRDYPPIDLLNTIALEKDVIAGQWKANRSAIIGPQGTPFARVRIPYHPPNEYDIEVVAERGIGADSFVIGLTHGRTRFAIILDGGDSHSSGIDLLDKKPYYDNDTTFSGKIFEQHRQVTIHCLVRNNRLQVTAEGKRIIDWKADYRRVSLFNRWDIPGPPCLFIGSWQTAFQIHKIHLTPVSGDGMALR